MAKPEKAEVVSLDTARRSAPKSIVSALEAHALALQAAGDHVGHGAIMDVATAAGMLKYKTAAIKGTVDGELGALLDRLHEIL